MDIWFRPLIWMDYRLGVLLAVIIPLVLLIWALFQRQEAMQRLLIIYWRVASLLMITVYLMVPAWGTDNSAFEHLCGQIGFITALMAFLLLLEPLFQRLHELFPAAERLDFLLLFLAEIQFGTRVEAINGQPVTS